MNILNFGILDVLDVILVATIIYQLYKLVRGTSVMSIFIGISCLYLLWIVVTALNMELMSLIMGQVVGVGVIALIIVFQQEIRRFLLYMGNKYFSKLSKSLSNTISSNTDSTYIDDIVTACESMAKTQTGALIVFARLNSLNLIQETGDVIDAKISSRLIETIFYKNCPLHDGAMIVQNGRIISARCVLPSTERLDIPAALGMRHKAAIGISEQTDALVVVVSEQTGIVSYIETGQIYRGMTSVQLKERLVKSLS
ncbi:MAG: diadenylate cyclase CdaA [Rikenellaceae bacterium]